MINRYTHNNITWLDVLKPTPDEVRELVEETNIPLEYAADLTTMSHKSDVFAKKGYLKVTLDFPIVKRTDINHPHEVKFLVTKKHLITVRFEDIEAIHRFGKEYEVLCMLGDSKKNGSSETLFFTMLNFMYDAMYGKLDYLQTHLQDIEEQIFNGHEKEMVFALSNISRKLISFRRVISSHENTLTKLRDSIQSAFLPKSAERVDELEHHYRNLTRHVYALISTLQDLRDTNNTLVSTKQNEIMKTFTILAFITFPLTLFTSTFGMNTSTTPIIGQPGDFWIIVSIMIVVSISFFAFFKYKRWI